MPAAHSVQLGAGWPPGLYDPALHKLHSDAPVLGLRVPAGQAVELLEQRIPAMAATAVVMSVSAVLAETASSSSA